MSDMLGPILPSAMLIITSHFQKSSSVSSSSVRTDTGFCAGEGGILSSLKVGKTAGDVHSLSQAGIQ